MGTWDAGPFGGDTAADFAGDLNELALAERPSAIREALEAVIGETGYVDSDEGAVAVAAAALVAAQCPGGDPADSVYGPDEQVPELPVDLRSLAVKALDRVVGPDSELDQLWDEGGAEECARRSAGCAWCCPGRPSDLIPRRRRPAEDLVRRRPRPSASGMSCQARIPRSAEVVSTCLDGIEECGPLADAEGKERAGWVLGVADGA